MSNKSQKQELCMLTNKLTNGVVNMKNEHINSHYLLSKLDEISNHVNKIYTIFNDVSKINGRLEKIIKYDSVTEKGQDFEDVHALLDEATENLLGKIYRLHPSLKMTEEEMVETWNERFEEQNFSPNSTDSTLSLSEALEGLR